jgi:cytoskeletal protein CcmA (bactofilin family)
MLMDGEKAMRTVKIIAVPALLLSLVAATDGIRASELDQFSFLDKFHLGSNDSHTGDLYVFAKSTSIDGTVDGDLVLWTSMADIDGTVTGDLIVGANQVDIAGRVTDTVRTFAATTIVSGTIEGDLVTFSGVVRIRPGAHITGNVVACSSMLQVDGTVDGDLTATTGEFELSGTVGRNVRIEGDAVKLQSDARILGDLTYESRKELELDEGALVAGETTFKEKQEKEEKDGGWFGMTWWLWSTGSAMVVGLALVALFRRMVPALTRVIAGEAMVGTLIGFGAFLVIPAASLLAMLLIISLPLGVVGLVLFFIAMYLAKMPVAIWLGERVMRLLGSSAHSPYIAVVLRLLILNLLFAIPYLGNLIWLVALWLGLGVTILATRSHLQNRTTQPAT